MSLFLRSLSIYCNPLYGSEWKKKLDLFKLLTNACRTFLFGYDSGIISSVISANYTYFQEYFGGEDGVVDANITGAIVSVFAGGAFCKFSLSMK